METRDGSKPITECHGSAESCPKKERSVNRRDFINQVGKAGVGAGLASFLLVGGIMKSAVAANDTCVAPYDDPSTNDNDDCCKATDDADECPATFGPPPSASGDECGTNDTAPDICFFISGYGEIGGDLCASGVDHMDACGPSPDYEGDIEGV